MIAVVSHSYIDHADFKAGDQAGIQQRLCGDFTFSRVLLCASFYVFTAYVIEAFSPVAKALFAALSSLSTLSAALLLDLLLLMGPWAARR